MHAAGEGQGRFVGKDPHKGVNPDEVVAVGARSRKRVLKGEVKDIYADVTPLSIGTRQRVA